MSWPRMEIMNDAFGCSRATQVHMELPGTVNLTEFVQDTTMNNQISLLLLWIDKLVRQQSNLKLLLTENLLNIFHVTTKQARTGSAWGTESRALNRRSMLEILLYFTLVFYCMSPNGPKLKV